MPAADSSALRPIPPGQSPFDHRDGGVSCGSVAPDPRRNVHTDRTLYFVITSNTKENVVKSVRTSLWATQRKNEQRLDEAFRTAPAVILVFSVNRSDAIQGYAIMRSPVGQPKSRQRDPFNGFGRLFDIEWLRLHDLPYKEVEHLRNPLNDNRPVHVSRDGQELSNAAGRAVCFLIDRHIDHPDSFPQAAPPPEDPGPWRPDLPPPVLMPLGSPPDGSGAARAPSPAGSVGSGGSEGGHKKRRRRERKYRNAPHPLTSDFDQHLQFFLDLTYEDYVSWYKRCGTVAPGPVIPSPPSLGATGSFQPAFAAPAMAAHHWYPQMAPYMPLHAA